MPLLNIICPICTDPFSNSDDVYSTSCGHLFHFACMNDWQRRGTSCPQCRHYNPKTYKLYLSFDETEENLVKDNEMELKLKESNEKITQLLGEMSETDTNFYHLQKQFTAIECSKRQLEQRIREMHDSEDNFLQLQGQYTEASELVNELKRRIDDLLIENESLQDGLGAGGTGLSDQRIDRRIKILELKLKNVNENLEKEINKNTQLLKEKMEMEIYIKKMDKVDKTIETVPQQSDERRENAKNCIISAKQNDGEWQKKIFIKSFPWHLIGIPFKDSIIELASKLQLSISADDIVKVHINKTDFENNKTQLSVEFKSTNLRDEFLSKKVLLQKDPATKNIVIREFLNEELLGLLEYAEKTLRNNGFNHFFYKKGKIFAKKNRSHHKVVHIQSKLHVDALFLNNSCQANEYVPLSADKESAVDNFCFSDYPLVP